MILNSQAEADDTRQLLGELEIRYKTRRAEAPVDPRVHALTLQSLKRFINQLKEQLAVFEAHSTAGKS